MGWILKLDGWGFPPRHQYVNDIAVDFLGSYGIVTPRVEKGLAATLSASPFRALVGVFYTPS